MSHDFWAMKPMFYNFDWKIMGRIFIFCDVITGGKWSHRDSNFLERQDFELNFWMQKNVFDFDYPNLLQEIRKEGHFSIFDVKKTIKNN